MATELPEASLAYAGALPLIWTPYRRRPDPAVLARYNDDNLQVLQAVAALEELTVEPDEEDGAIGQALLRLDMKVNLILDLVGKLATRGDEIPPSSPIRLGSRGLAWRGSAKIGKVGDTGIAVLYLRASPATPLRLAGRIEAVKQDDQDTAFELLYTDLDDAVRDALEKLIFRRHRRQIARLQPHD